MQRAAYTCVLHFVQHHVPTMCAAQVLARRKRSKTMACRSKGIDVS